MDTGTSKTVYTFKENQFVYGGFNDRILFRTDLGAVSGSETDDAFSPIHSYRFDAYDTDTGAMVDDLRAHLEFRVFVDGEKVDAEPYIKTYNGAPLFTD